MFKNTYQSGFLSILFAGGSRPLGIWSQTVKNGHIRRVTDEDVQSLALEIMGTNVATTYILCPADKHQTLGVRLPFFIMIVKNMKKYFTFEITVLDDKGMSRRFRVSNYQSTTRVRPFSTCLPIGLTGGWNQIQFNLADFTRRAYGSSYLETLRVQIHANVRIRRIYFSDRLYAEDEMPQEFKLYVPITSQKDKGKGKESLKIVMEDKGTGADKIRVSVEVKPEDEEGIPPTPTEGQEMEGEEEYMEGMEAGAAPPRPISADIGEEYGEGDTEIYGVADEVETVVTEDEGGEEAGDAGAPAPEEGAPAPDAGEPAPEAGDAGAPAPEEGAPAPEEGAPAPDAGAPAPEGAEGEEAPAPAEAEPEAAAPSEAPAETPSEDAPAEPPAE